LNASATEAIQNFLNRALSTSSLCKGVSGDRNAGTADVAGGGDGDRSVRRACGVTDVSPGATADTGDVDLLIPESDSSSEDDDSDSELSAGAGVGGALTGTLRLTTGAEGPEDDDEFEPESDDDDDAATRRLRFLVRFLACALLFVGAMTTGQKVSK
jgi:hypothetical protein